MSLQVCETYRLPLGRDIQSRTRGHASLQAVSKSENSKPRHSDVDVVEKQKSPAGHNQNSLPPEAQLFPLSLPPKSAQAWRLPVRCISPRTGNNSPLSDLRRSDHVWAYRTQQNLACQRNRAIHRSSPPPSSIPAHRCLAHDHRSFHSYPCNRTS